MGQGDALNVPVPFALRVFQIPPGVLLSSGQELGTSIKPVWEPGGNKL